MVVDASVAVKWLVEEDHSEQAVVLGKLWTQQGVQVAAPYLMPIEVANALHQKVRRQELSAVGAAQLLDKLMNTGVSLRQPRSIHSLALELARSLGQRAVYDSYYLALAEFLDCELWTADERFQRLAAGDFSRVKSIGQL